MVISKDDFVFLLEKGLIPLQDRQKNKKTSQTSINVSKRMKELHVPGLSIAILENFSIAHHVYYGKSDVSSNLDVQKDSIFHACSMSKFVSSLAILKLVEREILDLDTPVNQYLTSWTFPENEYVTKIPVTIRHLLSHQAGIIDPKGSFEVYTSKTAYPTNLELISGKTSYHLGEVQAKHIPGTKFNYSDGGFCVVEQIIQDVIHKSFIEFIHEEIFVPLKIHDAFYHSQNSEDKYNLAVMGHDSQGIKIDENRPIYPYMAAAGLWISPHSLAKIVLDFSLSFHGKGILLKNSQLVKDMVSSQGCFADVGLGVFIDGESPEPMMISNGWGIGFQSKIIAFPQSGSASIIMMNMEPGKPQHESIIGEIYRGIGRILSWHGF